MGNLRKNIERFRRGVREMGFSKSLSRALKEITGIWDCEEGLKTFYFLLDNYVDITKLPPISGEARKFQLCDAALLSIFDAICAKQGWQYWLSYGTLLGAVRHKGFIPWDDDLDICMMREDFHEAREKLPAILASFGEDSINSGGGSGGSTICLAINYKFLQTGIACDIFPVDKIRAENEDSKELTTKIYEYKKFYRTKGKKISPRELDSERAKIINSTEGEDDVLLFATEFSPAPLTFKLDSIFPLSTIEFEGYKLKAPRDIHKVLSKTYGDYMSFPRRGVIHHGGKIPRSEWASQNGINLDEVLEHLKTIEKFFRS